MARIKATGWGAAHVSCGRRHAPLRSGDDGVPRPWPAARRVRTPVGAGRFDFVLDDLDVYRTPDGPLPPSPRHPREVAHWERLAYDAGTLLSRLHPQRADALAAALTALTPRPEAPGGVVSSVSSGDAFGGVVLSEPPDHVEFAASLVHEFQHMKLHALLDSWPLHDESEEPDRESYYAPWRDDPRPLHGLFQGVFAFFGVVDFWRRLTLVAEGGMLRRAQFQLVYWRTQTLDAYTALRSSPRLTAKGLEFVQMMGDTTAAWTEHPVVPTDVTTLAQEAAAAHRVLWRLHHLRPDPAAVAELAEAWSPSSPGTAAQPVTVTVWPDPGVAPSNTYAALLCRAATDPATPHSWPASQGVPGSDETGVDPSDLARLLGSPAEACRVSVAQITRWPRWHESWVRLSLALRRANTARATEDSGPDTSAAAEALTHRPELVQALLARISERTGSPPDPVLLAQWVGAGVTTQDFPGLPRTDTVFKAAP